MAKLDFLEAYPADRADAFKAQSIQNGFVAIGIYPFDPDRVIQQFNIHSRPFRAP